MGDYDIILAELRHVKEGIMELKEEVKAIGKMDTLINHSDIGLMKRMAQMELCLKKIEEYITTQKAYAAAYGLIGGALVMLGKWLITFIK